MKKTLNLVLKNSIHLSLYILFSYFSLLVMMILGLSAKEAFMFPAISGFIHGDISHMLFNIIALLILLIPEVNRYNFRSIFFITLIISFIYLIPVFLGFPEAIGLSGTIYFLGGRLLLSSTNKHRYFLGSIFILALLMELTSIKNPDGIAHGVHVIGLLLGMISLKCDQIFPKVEHKISGPQ